MGGNYIYNVETPTANDQAANKSYVDKELSDSETASGMIYAAKLELNNYLRKDDSFSRTGNLNMNHKKITNLKITTNANDAATKQYADSHFFYRDGREMMTSKLDMNNRKVINPAQATSNSDGVNKKYVDDALGQKANSTTVAQILLQKVNKAQLDNYLKRDATKEMKGILSMDSHKITNVFMDYTSGTDATNKNYVYNLMHHSQVQPSHQKNELNYLMANVFGVD